MYFLFLKDNLKCTVGFMTYVGSKINDTNSKINDTQYNG